MKRLGIDIGSTTVKVAVIDEEHNILFSEYKRHFANIKETLKELVEHASKELGNVDIRNTRDKYEEKIQKPLKSKRFLGNINYNAVIMEEIKMRVRTGFV